MKKMKLFIDFDNTMVNSAKKAVEMLNEKYDEHKDWKYLKQYNFKDLFPQSTSGDINWIFDNNQFFTNLEMYQGALDTLEEVKKKYSISIVTCGTFDNLSLKKTWIDNNLEDLFDNFYGIHNSLCDKSSIDMSNGILIDDNINCLYSSNAKVKILFKNYQDNNWNRTNPCDNIYIVNTWQDINKILKFYIKEGKII